MLDQEIPNGKEVYIFTANRLNRFKGERPEIVTKLNWKTFTPKDSNARWIEYAWFTNDSIRAIIAQSEPKGLKKVPVTIDPSKTNTAFTLDIQEGYYKSEH
jgi:hypothetical protein